MTNPDNEKNVCALVPKHLSQAEIVSCEVEIARKTDSYTTSFIEMMEKVRFEIHSKNAMH